MSYYEKLYKDGEKIQIAVELDKACVLMPHGVAGIDVNILSDGSIEYVESPNKKFFIDSMPETWKVNLNSEISRMLTDIKQGKLLPCGCG